MNKTKEAIKDFVSRSGQHDTEVHESINPAVTHENVKKTHHEDVNTAIDREVHHDHYHHTVQPVKDRQVLPEEHVHQIKGVEHREFDERNHDRTRQAVSAEAAKFKDERVVEPTIHTKGTAPVVGGEHHHHHIHETVQPVIQRETVQPTVVHTTIPIHETHHKEAKHHSATALPAISMDEFKSKGGLVGVGSKTQEHHYRYEGEPTEGGKIESGTRGGIIGGSGSHHHHGSGKAMAGGAAATAAAGGVAAGRRRRHHKRTNSNSSYSSSDLDEADNARGNYSTGSHSKMGAAGAGGAAMVGASAATAHHDNLSHKMDATGTAGRTANAAPGTSVPGGTSHMGNTTGMLSGTSGTGATSNMPGTTTKTSGMDAVPRSEQHMGANHGGVGRDAAGHPVGGETKKPSLLNKLNPLTDSNGDGKAGFMK